MLKYGYITELDISKGMVRVNFTEDGIVSNLLPVSVPATKNDKYSFPFAINEHVWCLMDENCEFGVVGGAIYSAKDKPPAAADKNKILMDIGATKLQIEIDRQSGNLKIKSSGNIEIEAGTTGSVNVKAVNMKITGNVAVTGTLSAAGFGGAQGAPLIAPNGITTDQDVKAGTVSLKSHKHTGAGAGNPTSTPIP